MQLEYGQRAQYKKHFENRVQPVLDHFASFPAAIELSEPMAVTALLCPSWYWANTRDEYAEHNLWVGPTYRYNAAPLQLVDTRFSPQKRLVCVIFVIGGDPEALRIRRILFHNGEIYIPNEFWRPKYAEILHIIESKRKEAQRRMDDLVAAGAV